jgi:proteasome lid subunit RPN8/RPN11
MITLARGQLEEMLRHLEERYPQEGCGALLGRSAAWAGGTAWQVTGVHPAASIERSRPCERYDMDPRDMLAAEDAARLRGDSVIGIYHSHPDRAAQPSSADLERAWPSYAYMVASVRNGKAAEWACWVLEDGGKAFRPRIVRLTGGE